MISFSDNAAGQQGSAGLPGHEGEHGALSDDVWRAVRRKARQMAGRAGFAKTDRQDFEQELALRLWQGLANFDPAVGHEHGFVATVLNRAATSLLRTRNSRRRGGRLAHRSLDTGADDRNEWSASGESSDALSSDDSPHEKAFDLAHDVAVVLRRLPPGLRSLAEALKHHSVSEVAGSEGLSRSTVYARIRQMRAYFTAAGFEENF